MPWHGVSMKPNDGNSEGPPRLKYLDGLRALAIAGVLGVHSIGAYMPGGHLGVSVFFVLSGFLISTLLIHELDRGKIHFRDFYVKRAARLLPGLIVVLVVSGLWSLTQTGLLEVLVGTGSALFYVTNFVAAIWGQENLAHFEWAWTLSLEEQFYFLWPIVLALLFRSRFAIGIVLSAGIIASEVFRVLGSVESGTPSMFFAPHTRMSGLLVGALLALVVANRALRFSTWLSFVMSVTSGLIILSGFFFASIGDRVTYVVWIPLVEIASAALIASLVFGKESWAHRLLSLRPLAFIGAISYGIYLWNIPVTEFVASQPLGSIVLSYPVRVATTIILTLTFAAVSYRFLERPAQRAIRNRWVRQNNEEVAIVSATEQSRT